MTIAPHSLGKPRLVLALLVLTGAGLQVIPFLLTPPARLEVQLRDSTFNSDLTGKVAQITYGGEPAGLPVPIRSAAGGFEAHVGNIPSGSGTLTVNVEGYEAVSLPLDAPPLQTVRPTVDLLPTFGRLDVKVINARDAGQIVSARVGVDGQALPEPTTVADLAPGEHRVTAEASGFCAAEQKASIEKRKTTSLQLPISPVVANGQVARILLDWGENPHDLDAHLNLDASPVGLSAPHVFFVNKKGTTTEGTVFAELDVDHTNSEGVETVTIYDVAPGDYQYFVHLYGGSGTLGTSGATVEILTKGCESQRFTVPPGCAKRWWYVADLKISPAGVETTSQGKCLDQPEDKWKRQVK
jgi:hypothetical protein